MKLIKLPNSPTIQSWVIASLTLCREELMREADAGFIGSYIYMALQGIPHDKIRSWVRASDEYAQRHRQHRFNLGISAFDGDPSGDHKVVEAHVTVQGPETKEGQTDGAGNLWFEGLQQGEYAIVVEGGHASSGRRFGAAALSVHLDAEVHVDVVVPAEDVAAPTPTEASRALTTKGPLFVFEDDGSPFRYRGLTAFLLYKYFLDDKDIEAFFRFAQEVGANVLRVFLMSHWMNGGGPLYEFHPDRYGDKFFDQLVPFARLCASKGFRVEFVVFADAQEILPFEDEQQRFLDNVVAEVRDEPNVFLEVCNEARGQQNGVNVKDVKPRDPGRLLWAAGDDEVEAHDDCPVGRYMTYHGDRDAFWPGEAIKESHFYYDGWNAGPTSFWRGAKVPCINDEPMGANEKSTNDFGDRRDTNPDNFEDAGAGMALSGAGGTFHSEDLCIAKVPGPIQAKCAKAFFHGMDLVPLPMPTAPYEHDGTAGHVLQETREASEVGSRAIGNLAIAVAANTTNNWRAEARGGWKITKLLNARGTIIELQR